MHHKKGLRSCHFQNVETFSRCFISWAIVMLFDCIVQQYDALNTLYCYPSDPPNLFVIPVKIFNMVLSWPEVLFHYDLNKNKKRNSLLLFYFVTFCSQVPCRGWMVRMLVIPTGSRSPRWTYPAATSEEILDFSGRPPVTVARSSTSFASLVGFFSIWKYLVTLYLDGPL